MADIITAQEAAARLGVTKGQLTHWVRHGVLPSGRFGRAFTFDADVVERFRRFRQQTGRQRLTASDMAGWKP